MNRDIVINKETSKKTIIKTFAFNNITIFATGIAS